VALNCHSLEGQRIKGLMTNAKAQMSNECQSPNFKTMIILSDSLRHLFIWIKFVILTLDPGVL
jgi:hypothetical protein